MSLRQHDRITVLKNGEEIDVFNWVNISRSALVRGSNPTVETFAPAIGAGDSPRPPEAVTTWVAEELRHEFDIDPETHDIDVIDPDSDDITILSPTDHPE